jgi:hypothetical protein
MFLTEIAPAKEDFDQCSWQEVITSSEKKDCKAYVSLLSQKAKEAEEQGDNKSQAVFALLYHICSLMLKLDTPNEPFAPMLIFADRRSAIIDDFNEAHLKVLEEIASSINDAELRARIADILWYKRKGGYKMAELAIQSYIESANILEDPRSSVDCFHRIERAAQLAVSLGKNNQPFKDVIKHIESVLDKYNGEDPMFLSAKLMELLQEYREGEPSKYAAIAEKAALNAEASDDVSIKWHRARTYWEIKARWYAIAKDDENVRLSMLNAAETYVKEAEDALNRPNNPYSIASSFLQQAIEAYRRVEGSQERRDEIHKKLLEYQKKSMADFQAFSHTIDISAIVEEASNLVKGKTVIDALFTLALASASPSVAGLRKRVQETANEFKPSLWIPAQVLNKEGKVVAKRPGMYENDGDTNDALRAEMFRRAALEQNLHAQAVVQPAINQINTEHNVRITDLLPVVSHNPFVPPGREYIFAKGLHAIFVGDLVTTAHLLIPQVENSVRHLLTMQGVIVSGLDQGIQDERSLNTTLYKTETLELFGEDIVFDLQGLLVERFGSNLRNQMAHGLMNYAEFYSWPVVYLWWLVLRLCCLPIYAHIYGKNETKNNEEQQTGTPN